MFTVFRAFSTSYSSGAGTAMVMLPETLSLRSLALAYYSFLQGTILPLRWRLGLLLRRHFLIIPALSHPSEAVLLSLSLNKAASAMLPPFFSSIFLIMGYLSSASAMTAKVFIYFNRPPHAMYPGLTKREVGYVSDKIAGF